MTEENSNFDLDRVGVASPCPESWNGMEGDERVRFCERCALHVYNLSGMTRDEASDLVSGAEGRLCVRFFRRDDGTVLTRDCPVGLARRTGRFLRAVAASLLALLGFLPSCGSSGDESTPDASPTSSSDSATDDGLEEIQGEPWEELGDVEFLGDVEIMEEPVELVGKVKHEPAPADGEER